MKKISIEAKEWAVANNKKSIEEFYYAIDTDLYNEIKIETKLIKEFAQNKLTKLNISLGGGGNYILLYFLIRKFKLTNIVETGVAAGWTSLAILRALKNEMAFYTQAISHILDWKIQRNILVVWQKIESNVNNWFLDIRGDEVALPEIARRLENKSIDLFHYDSDKSYSGRSNALKILGSKINSNTIIIFDDIQNNLQFKDFVKKNKKDFSVFEFEGKYIGIVNSDYLKI